MKVLKAFFKFSWRVLKWTFLTLVLLTAYFLWPGFSPDTDTPPQTHLNVIASYGLNSGNGNVVGIEPYMEPLDYSSEARFHQKLDLYFKQAKMEGWFTEGTIILLPEHLGTWLVAEGHKSRVYSAKTTEEAMRYVAAWNIFEILKNLFIFDGEEKPLEAALFRSKSPEMAAILYRTFSKLAKEYDVTIVAGSSMMMTPAVYEEGLAYGHGPLFNASFVFGPDGKPQIDAIRKVHPVNEEVDLITKGQAEHLPVFEAGEHHLAVLVCADSWFTDTYKATADQGADLLLVPAYLSGADWYEPWQGYRDDQPLTSGWQQDVGNISEGDAWIKYSLPAKAPEHNIRNGMTIFLKGQLWEITGSGRALILENGTVHVGKNDDSGAALYNLWL